MAEWNHYKTLQLRPNASAAEIGRAYRRLARQYHPDANPAAGKERAARQMRLLNEAYEVLRDPLKRATYDRTHGFLEPTRGTEPGALRTDTFPSHTVPTPKKAQRSPVSLPLRIALGLSLLLMGVITVIALTWRTAPAETKSTLRLVDILGPLFPGAVPAIVGIALGLVLAYAFYKMWETMIGP
ncbi:MAG: DnaJ domain-containing protein [Anaerolineae bacterium]